MTAELFRDQNSHALIVFKRGHKLLHAVALYQPPVRIVRMARQEERYLTPLTSRGEPYPLKRALRHFKLAGRTFGITKSAKTVLGELVEPT